MAWFGCILKYFFFSGSIARSQRGAFRTKALKTIRDKGGAHHSSGPVYLAPSMIDAKVRDHVDVRKREVYATVEKTLGKGSRAV
jgi:hypothetical protein